MQLGVQSIRRPVQKWQYLMVEVVIVFVLLQTSQLFLVQSIRRENHVLEIGWKEYPHEGCYQSPYRAQVSWICDPVATSAFSRGVLWHNFI